MKILMKLFIFVWDNDFEIFVGRNTLSIGESFAEICRPLHQIWSTMSSSTQMHFAYTRNFEERNDRARKIGRWLGQTMSKNGTHRRSTPNGLRATPMSKYELKIWYF